MMRTIILTLAVVLAALPSAAQDPVAEAAKAAKAQSEAARKVVREVERAQRVDRMQRVEKREDQRAQQTEAISRTVKLGPQGEIDLQNMSGSITVTRGGGNDVTINAVKTARAATEAQAREMLGLAKVDIVERAGRVEVRTHYMHAEVPPPPPPPPPPPAAGREVPPPPRRPMRRNISVSVEYTISAPAGTKLRINSMSGDIAVSDITGEQVLEAMSGSIRIERGARVQIAKTMSGDVSISDTKSDGALDAGSMSGDVTLRQVKARRINTAVISGTVSLVDVDAERVDAQTTSGNVVYEGTLTRNGRYRLGAHSGNVKVLVGGETGFVLDANSFGGTVRSDVPLKDEERGMADLRRTRVGAGAGTGTGVGVGASAGGRVRTLKGTYGDGSAVLDLTTFSGTIVVGKRVAEKR